MLLCNYFNYIDIENGRQHKKDGPKDGKDLHSYIVYGEAVPDGCAWFVARIDNNSSSDKHTCELWNPMTAECYNFDKISQNTQQVCGKKKSSNFTMRLFDPICTMKKVWCIVGEENVWANI